MQTDRPVRRKEQPDEQEKRKEGVFLGKSVEYTLVSI